MHRLTSAFAILYAYFAIKLFKMLNKFNLCIFCISSQENGGEGGGGGAAGKAPKAATANWKFRCPRRGNATQLSATQLLSECIEWVSDAFARTRPLATVSCNNSPCNSFGFGFECESRAASGLSQPSFKFNAAQRRCPWRRQQRRRWQRRWRRWRPWELCDKLPSDDACGMRPSCLSSSPSWQVTECIVEGKWGQPLFA